MKKNIFVFIAILSVFTIFGVKAADISYDKYDVGDLIEVKGSKYYVIKASNENDDYVVALKQFPLTVNEITTYGVENDGTSDLNYINNSLGDKAGNPYQFDDENNTGGVAYYSGYMCDDSGQNMSTNACKKNYDDSNVKKIINLWVQGVFTNDELKEVSGYKARLLLMAELSDQLGYSKDARSSSIVFNSDSVPSWVFSQSYKYWIMPGNISNNGNIASAVLQNGQINSDVPVYSYDYAIRPVINVYKKDITLIEKAQLDTDVPEESTNSQNNKSNNKKVKVENTLLKKSLVLTFIGLLLVGTGVVTYIYVKKSQKKSK